MIYLVSLNKQLFESDNYKYLSKEDALIMILSWNVVQFDTETSGKDPHICKLLCYQFGNREADTQIVGDNATVPITYFKEVFETKLIIGHNLKFDDQFLFKYGIIPKKQYDTMIVEQFLHLGYDNKFFHYSLKAVAMRYLGIDIDKTTRGEIIWRGLDDQVIVYAAGDVVPLEDIRDKQLPYVEERNGKIGMDLENAFVVVMAYLEWSGIHLDVDKWKTKMSKDKEALDESIKALNDWVLNYYNNDKNNTHKEVWLKVKENNHGYVEEYDIPKNAKAISLVEKRIGEFGIEEYWQQFRFPSPWKQWIKVDLQGDLFSGWNTEPQCCLNWASSKQLIPFFQYIGFNTTTVDKKSGEEKDSITEKVLKKQKGIHDDFLRLYLGEGKEEDPNYFPGYTGSAKVCSTYGQNYIDAINPITNRIHTSFWQIGAASGRMTCGSKNSNTDLAKIKGISPKNCKYVQLQTLPHDEHTRAAFTSMENNTFISCDYSAMESRLGADIYNEPSMIDEFINGSGDIHSLMALTFFGDKMEPGTTTKEIKKKYPDLRNKSKSPEFLIQFGGSARGLADQLNIDIKIAQTYVDKYYNKFKMIADFKSSGHKFVKEHGFVKICSKTGHWLLWEDWKKWRTIEDMPESQQKAECSKKELEEHNKATSKWGRMALNAPTQGTGAVILKMACVMFFKWVVENNLFNKVLFCTFVHDEINIECPTEIKDLVASKLTECMERSAKIFCPKVPIPAEANIGDHWIH